MELILLGLVVAREAMAAGALIQQQARPAVVAMQARALEEAAALRGI
jgi:hypothetical protein